MTPRRSVIVGTGSIAGAHVAAIVAQGGRAIVVAGVDLELARAKEFADRHGIAGWGTDLADVLA